MNILATRTVAALIYVLLMWLGAEAVWRADDTAALPVIFFAWNAACATLFACVVMRTSGMALAYVLLVVLFGSLLQLATLNVLVSDALGTTLGAAFLGFPGSLFSLISSDPLLYCAWIAVPLLAAGTALHFRWGRVTS